MFYPEIFFTLLLKKKLGVTLPELDRKRTENPHNWQSQGKSLVPSSIRVFTIYKIVNKMVAC